MQFYFDTNYKMLSACFVTVNEVLDRSCSCYNNLRVLSQLLSYVNQEIRVPGRDVNCDGVTHRLQQLCFHGTSSIMICVWLNDKQRRRY